MKTQNKILITQPPQLQISAESIAALSLHDQNLFVQFGVGPEVTPKFDHIYKAFQEMVKLHPTLPAVRQAERALTYCEFSVEVDKLASLLFKNGIRRGDKVGIFLERSIEMVVAIFAILKIGATYVPQDARIVPIQSLQHVTKTAEVKVILTFEKFVEKLQAKLFVPMLAIDNLAEAVLPMHIEPGFLGATDDVCFVLFTSGTTGKPNGVEVTHKNLCNIILTEPGNLGMGPGKVVSHILNISFDMAAWEILGALTNGAELLVRGQSIEAAASQADVIIATPSVLASIEFKNCKRAKVVAVAGEPCPKSLAEKWGTQVQFYNCCGPTEVTIVNTMHAFNAKKNDFSIGKPTPNNTVYVLDDHLNPLPIGEIGEMWAGGDCVSLGYINNCELTEARYKDDPFLGGGRKMFRTRDLGRWNEFGELEHLGRTDDQVKVRGFRVELDSVSKALESIPGCLQAVAIKFDDRDLVAFVTGDGFAKSEVDKVLSARLPYYAIPREVFVIADLPRTDRGKVDKRELKMRADQMLQGAM